MDFIVPEYMGAFDGEALTVSTSSIPLNSSVFKPGTGPTASITAQAAILTVSAQPISIRFDGTTATPTNGLIVPAGSSIVVYGLGNIQKIRMIRQGASDATVEAQYFG